MFKKLKLLIPRGLYGRAALILIVPVVAIQLVVSIAFIQRHFERVTRQMTSGVVIELNYMLTQMETAPTEVETRRRLDEIGLAMGFTVEFPTTKTGEGDGRELIDLAGKEVIATLRGAVLGMRRIDLLYDPSRVEMLIDTTRGPLWLTVDRGRLSASNPHQLLVVMLFTSVLMTLIAYGFLRNQLRPITRLADAAAAFGKGQTIRYRPRGALEVRAAGKAFLDMRGRIERQIEQRTMMLSGISHDLRTPLTRLRLGLSMLPEDEDTVALLGDVRDMERLIDGFLAFARGDATEEAELTNPRELIKRVVDNAVRAGHRVMLGAADGQGDVTLRQAAVTRALENLIGNGIRFGSQVRVSFALTARNLRIVVEDDGPGIPQALREAATVPFERLDSARNPNRGGGVGLGLAITQDIAQSHGGKLMLSQSEDLGGLKAEFVIAC